MIGNLFADALAAGDDTQQADFLNSFVQSLNRLCRHSIFGGSSMQVHCIAGRLTQEAADLLKDLAETHEFLKTNGEQKLLQARETLKELDVRIADRKRYLEEL